MTLLPSRTDPWQPEHSATRGFVGRYLLPGTVATFLIYSATSVYVRPKAAILYAVVVAVAGVLAIHGRRAKVPKRARQLCTVWLGTAALYLVVSSFQTVWSPRHVIGDFAVSVLPLLVMLAALRHKEVLTGRRSLYVLLTGASFAACAAYFIGQVANRHEPPSPFLMAGAWYFLLTRQGPAAKVLTMGWTLGVGCLAYSSGSRTHLFVWLIAPVVVLAITYGWKGLLGGAALLVAITTVAFAVGHPVQTLERAAGASRFETLLDGNRDVSLSVRLSEAHDVTSTARHEWIPPQAVFGYGYGATYVPARSYIVRNVGESGRVHSIHIGPMLVFFRFGVLGIAAFGLLVGFVIRMLRRIRRRLDTWPDQALYAICGIAIVLFLVEFLTLNSSVEPMASLSLGILLAVWAVRPVRGGNCPPTPKLDVKPSGGSAVAQLDG